MCGRGGPASAPAASRAARRCTRSRVAAGNYASPGRETALRQTSASSYAGRVTHDVNVLLAVLGVAGQIVLLGFAIVGIVALAGDRRPLDAVRGALWGYELWLAFLVAAAATAGSLYYSEIAGYVPCELCWFQRICMYPLSILTLLMALGNDHRAARYLLPLPVVGGGLAIYHMLVERGVVGQTAGC